MGKCHLKSLYERVFKHSNSISVQRSHPAFSILVSEYPHEYSKQDESFIIRGEIADIQERRSILMALRGSIERHIPMGSSEFEYFVNEFRQNQMMRDSRGNILLDDATISSTRRR